MGTTLFYAHVAYKLVNGILEKVAVPPRLVLGKSNTPGLGWDSSLVLGA